MEFFDSLLKGFSANPSGALCVVLLIALSWLAKALWGREQEHRKEVSDLHAQHLKAVQDSNTAHLATAMQVAPLAAKLVTCVEVLERLSNYATRREV